MSSVGNQAKYSNCPAYNNVGDGTTVNFNLTWTPGTPNSLLVFLSGIMQRPWNGTTGDFNVSSNVLTFFTAPAGGVNINVVGLTASVVRVPLANIPGGTAGSLVYQTGVDTTGFSSAGTTGQISTSGGTGSPTWSDIGLITNGYTSKATPVDADSIPLSDSAAANGPKKLTWANLKATLLGTANTFTAQQSFTGTAATAPAIAGASDPNTGVFFPAADTVAVATAGIERMRIDSGGNVGVGVTPTNQFDVERGTSNGVLRVVSKLSNGSQNMTVSGSGIQQQFGANTGQVWGGIGGYTNGSTALFGLWGPSGVLTGVPHFSMDANYNTTLNQPGGLGYGTGAGGTVTQATSKSTAVTLNKPTGEITMNNEALGAGASVTFTCNNSLTGNHLVVANINSAFGVQYRVKACSDSGAIYFTVTNETAGSLSDAVVIKFGIYARATT